MKKNTAELWDALWKNPAYRKDDLRALEKEYLSVRWQRIERIILEEFGTFEGLRVVEVGAGAGKAAALFAKQGAEIAVIDYAQGALERAAALFQRLNIAAELLQQDALDLPPKLCGRFDVSMSFGLAEHFTGNARVEVNKAHFDLLRPGGIALIAVPNKYNPPYRLYKAVVERLGTWRYGEEYPYSRAEFETICKELDVKEFSFFGDSFWHSFRFVNPLGSPRKLLGLKRSREKGSPLDAYLSYSLVLCAKKPSDGTARIVEKKEVRSG